ncbi:MAG: hypothetical protein ACRYFA_11650 [Janthinobacterium lividum]
MPVKFNIHSFLKYILVFLFFNCCFNSLKAQTDSAAQKPAAPTKELFLHKFEAYQTGKNRAGLMDVADRNQYPSPQKVLLWQKELLLNDRQKAAIGLINKEMQRKTIEMNNFLITNEGALDSLFKLKKINNGLLIFYTNRYGLYQGELRNALLQACLKTEAILTATQLKKYDTLLLH